MGERPRRRLRADAWNMERPDPIEMIGRMLVGSSYRVPVEGVGSRPGLQPCDIAGAVGLIRDRVSRDTAVAVATRADHRVLAKLSLSAYRRVAYAIRVMQAPRPLDLSEAADRFRMRMVITDAAHDLVWPERRRPFRELAKQAKMRKADYIRAHRAAYATLEEALADARRSFRRRLG